MGTTSSITNEHDSSHQSTPFDIASTPLPTIHKSLSSVPPTHIELETKEIMGSIPGKIYTSISADMGGSHIFKRDDREQKLYYYWCYDDQYETPPYFTYNKFIKGYMHIPSTSFDTKTTPRPLNEKQNSSQLTAIVDLPPTCVEMEAKKIMGDILGKIYIVINGGMGGSHVFKRDGPGQNLKYYWSYDDQYEEPPYATFNQFIDGHIYVSQ